MRRGEWGPNGGGHNRAVQVLVLGLKLLGPVVVDAAMCGAVTAMSAVSRVLEGRPAVRIGLRQVNPAR
jgi:hypothetical protein